MFFYIDESGNTGLNLFDPVQPTLYYGVAASEVDLDSVVGPRMQAARAILGVDRIHAKALGNDNLSQITLPILSLISEHKVAFDLYKVEKGDHAIMAFFDQVFDSGMNEAVSFINYWSIHRYLLLFGLAQIFDEEVAKQAWSARIEGNAERAQEMLRVVCSTLLKRVGDIESEFVRTRIADALTWAIRHPEAIGYNATNEHIPKKDKEARKYPSHQISPNIIGFQLVMKGIGERLRQSGAQASRIVVDQQAEFNHSQNTLAKFYAEAAGLGDFVGGPGMPVVNFDHIPATPIEFQSSDASAGLELVDILLWIHRRRDEGKPLSHELLAIAEFTSVGMQENEISLNALAERWMPQIMAISTDFSDLTPEQLAQARELQGAERTRIKAVLQDT